MAKANPQEQAVLKGIFDKYDINKDGHMSGNELVDAFYTAGVCLDTEDAKKVVKQFDKDGDKRLNFQEFISMVSTCKDNLQVMFKNIDKDNNGWISKAEFEQLLKQRGSKINTEEAMRSFATFDKNHDNRITFDEFVGVLRKTKG